MMNKVYAVCRYLKALNVKRNKGKKCMGRTKCAEISQFTAE